MKKILMIVFSSICILFLVVCVHKKQNEQEEFLPTCEKPVIYLYPTEETEVFIELDFNGKLLFTYPTYDNGWQVTAYSDGTIISDGREYSYLFWDGYIDIEYDLSKGFVVKGEDTEDFLIEKLKYLGLTSKEYNEFIVYWLPRMIENPYNLITFQEEEYTDNAVLTITPTPDSIKRIFMVFKPLEEEIEIEPQQLTPFTRNGFAVVEWGGTEIID